MKCLRCRDIECEIKIYEGVEIDVCPSCGGVWLDSGELKKIIDSREVVFDKEYIKEVVENSFAGVSDDEQNKQLICPKCGDSLYASNYDYASGIIIDVCPNGDGMWLDEGELQKIEAYREGWEKRAAEMEKELSDMAEEVRKEEEKKIYENEVKRRYFHNKLLGFLLKL